MRLHRPGAASVGLLTRGDFRNAGVALQLSHVLIGFLIFFRFLY